MGAKSVGSRVCHCVLASWVCISVLSQRSGGQLREEAALACQSGGVWASSRLRLIRQKSEAWMVANEAPFPLPGNGLKEETSLRLGQEL